MPKRRITPAYLSARRALCCLTWPLALAVSACSAEGDTPSDPKPDASVYACAQTTDSYHAGLAKLGPAGHFRVAIVDADPAPPARYDNRWVIEVEDADGDVVPGATLRVNPDMPEHGHGVLRPVVVTDEGAGRYGLEPLHLHMPGYWEIPIEIALGAEVDTVTFAFCILP